MSTKPVIHQETFFEITDDPVIKVYEEKSLPVPELQGVRVQLPFQSTKTLFGESAQICTIVGYPIQLEWRSVGETFSVGVTEGLVEYVVQLSPNSEFTGAGVKTFRVPDSDRSAEEPLNVQCLVYAGNSILKSVDYWWRVFAITNVGWSSPKSEIWSISFNCSADGGGAGNGGTPEPSSSSSSSSSASQLLIEENEFVSNVTCSGGVLSVQYTSVCYYRPAQCP